MRLVSDDLGQRVADGCQGLRTGVYGEAGEAEAGTIRARHRGIPHQRDGHVSSCAAQILAVCGDVVRIFAVVEPRVLDFGPTVYVGELRTEDDKPISEHLHGKADGRNIYPMTVGLTEAGVLEKLRERARQLSLARTVVIRVES